MNQVELQWQLQKVIPARLYSQVAWVFERKYWDEIEIGFYTGHGNIKSVVIPKDYWLDDRSIARLCLEAP